MILFFDTETTGLPKSWDAPITDLDNWPRLVQLAYEVYDYNGNNITSGDFIIKPNGFTIPVESTLIHKITNEKANNSGFDLRTVLEIFNRLLQSSSIVVAHNIAYDERIIEAEFFRCGIQSVLPLKRKICTMQSSINYCAINTIHGYKWPKLSELHVKLFGVNFEEAHNASIDIKATAKCFWKLIDLEIISISGISVNQKSVSPTSSEKTHINLGFDVPDYMSKIFPFYRKSEGKYCYLDKSGAVITDFKYSYAGELLNGVAKVACRNKWGFINSEGKELVPLIYDYCHDIKNGYAIVKTESKVGVINEHGHLCIPLQAGEIQQSSYYNIFSVFSPDNNKWGIVDCFNRTIKPHEYSNITFTNSPYIICAKTNDFELFNLKNNTTCLINNASSVEHLVDCFFEVRSLNNNVGFLNIHLNKIFWVSGSIQYIRIGSSSKYVFEAAKVNKENSKSELKDIFNENGKTILTEADYYVEHVDNNEGCIFFKKGTKWFAYNSINEKLSAGKFEHITNFHNERAVATIANTPYIVDSNINAIEKLPFSYVKHWGTFSIVEKDGKWGVINLSFEIVIPILYDRIDKLRNADVYYGFINDKKHIITPRGFVSKHCYQDYEDYTYEIAKRNWEDDYLEELDDYNNDSVLYDHEMTIDLVCEDLVDKFKNGVAWVFRNGFFGLINTNGVEITEFKYIIPKEIIGNIFLSPRESGYYDLDGNIYWM